MTVNKTKIEWVKNPDGSQGYTWNPITGCLNGCSYCYARRLSNGRLRTRYRANTNLAPPVRDVDETMNPFYPRFWPEKLKEFSELAYKPKGIFTCDMSDLFGIGVPEEWTRQVLSTIKYQFFHRFYLLTKQPQNLIKFSPFPDNCWVGVTATGHFAFIEAVKNLRKIEAKVKYLSFEPLLEQCSVGSIILRGINWVIIGAQTKPSVYPKIEWVEEIVRACDKAGVPVFLKDNLKPMFGKMTSKEAVAYGDLNRPYLIEEIAFAEDNMLIAHKLRQEFPK